MFKGLLLLIILTLALHAQVPPGDPTLILVADGDLAEYTSISAPPSNWFEPDYSSSWKTAPAGFGGTSRATEVSTIEFFGTIRLRQRFDLTSSLESLTLSLKQDDADLEVYLNGVQVLNLVAGELPPPDLSGYRHYDLGSLIPSLIPFGNLLAIYSEGRILTPILHGTSLDKIANSIAVEPTRTRLIEGGQSLPIRVFRLSPTSSATRIHLPPAETASSSSSDFLFKLDDIPLPLITNDHGRYFQVPFSDDETEKIIELEVIDDIHAEGQEIIELKSYGPTTRFVINRNDSIVTRTTAQGEGSLRQAIENAELNPGLETIRFDNAEGIPFASAPVTVHLHSGSPGRYGLREGFTIEGPPSPGRVTIQATGGPLFYISGAAGATTLQDLTLRRLVIQGSSLVVRSVRYGGTILIEDCEFIGNDRVLDLYGRNSPAVVRRCLFTGNTRECVDQGSGLPPKIEDCTFAFNSGTNIDMRSGTSIESCTFVGDETRFASGRAQFRNCLFAGTSSDIKIINSDVDQGGNLFASTLRNGELFSPRDPSSLAVSPRSSGLGNLGFHGGFTRTIPILPTSPALDLGIASEDGSNEFDQRGEPFLRRVGPSPDAGAFELPLVDDAVVIGATSEVIYDSIAGLYFQFVLIHNQSPWALNSFRLLAEGLPDDAILYNTSGDGFIEVAGPLSPADYQIVAIQYFASRPDLLLAPNLSLEFVSSAADPYQPPPSSPDLTLYLDESASPCLTFRTEPGEEYQVQVSSNGTAWLPAGPALLSESRRLSWKDPDENRPTRRFYRVSTSR